MSLRWRFDDSTILKVEGLMILKRYRHPITFEGTSNLSI